MKKQNSPLIAALIVTGVLFAIMTATSVNALMNKNGTAVGNIAVSSSQSSDQARIAELQARVDEYAQREIQYQQILEQDQAKIDQYGQFVLALQRAGVIRVRADGSVVINSGASRDGDND